MIIGFRCINTDFNENTLRPTHNYVLCADIDFLRITEYSGVFVRFPVILF